MANHRTTLKLKPYKGYEMERVTKDGKHTYLAHKGGEVLDDNSLYGLKKAINWTLGIGRLV